MLSFPILFRQPSTDVETRKSEESSVKTKQEIKRSPKRPQGSMKSDFPKSPSNTSTQVKAKILTQAKVVSYFKTTKNEQLTEYICPTCRECFLQEYLFVTHCEACDKHFCCVCKKTFWSSRAYKKHCVSNCPPKRFGCGCCKKTYSRKSDRDNHQKKCLLL